jgi:hypothetical protein
MNSMIEAYGPSFGLLSGVAVFVVYIFEKFATVRYVDEKYEDAIEHTDQQTGVLVGHLDELKEMIKTIDQRIWELQRENLR